MSAGHELIHTMAASGVQLWCPFDECIPYGSFNQPCQVEFSDGALELLSAANTVNASPARRRASPPAPASGGKIIASRPPPSGGKGGRGKASQPIAAAAGGTPPEAWAALSDLRFSLHRRRHLLGGSAAAPGDGQWDLDFSGDSDGDSDDSGGERQRFAGTTPYAQPPIGTFNRCR